MSKFKNQKVNFYYTVPYSILSQRINQIFEILELLSTVLLSHLDQSRKLLHNATFYQKRLKLCQCILQ